MISVDKILEDNYKKVRNYFPLLRNYILFTLILFALSFLVGFIYPNIFRAEILLMIEDLIAQVGGKGALELTGFIFLNNMKVALLSIVAGIFVGIFPLISIIFNGYLIGFVSNEAVKTEGVLVLWRLLPHGIFELPAIIFSIAIGLKIGRNVFLKNNKEKLKRDYTEGLRFYFFVVFPLLLIAAIIEGLLIAFSS